ncbi:MAG: hypothetical protein JNL58_12450 [Planctomyces sp.]|nr:hypothetical protein [Planctomyces sp.]
MIEEWFSELLSVHINDETTMRTRTRFTLLSIITLVLWTVVFPFGLSEVHGDESVEVNRRKTAVTLNYCRAALHRIRKAPSKRVLLEEQQRILNNLDLNQIDDAEVITLYRSILDEIGQVEITDRERIVIEEQFRRGLHRKLGTDFFVIGAQVATGQLGSVIQSGANSWWDYRTTQLKRDADMWQVEKTQFSNFMTRSSTFLDSFWKLSRKNEIPDKWLLRDQDLDQLEDVLDEQEPERRLRMLGRLEKFMECYPPYWYYVARTQQQLGRLDAAAQTYERLTEIGKGHFRQDDMLAGSLANLALIQETQGKVDAQETAQRAFDYSSRNWEANLVCAWVLGRHREYVRAEDLLLCNLDEDLESDQSSVALVSLYYHSNDATRLTRLLEDEELMKRVPVPGLLLCAKMLGTDKLPEGARSYLGSTLSATRRQSGRVSSIAVSASSNWKLADAAVRMTSGDQVFHSAGEKASQRGLEVNFVNSFEQAAEVDDQASLLMTLTYPATPPIQIVLMPDTGVEQNPVGGKQQSRRLSLFGSGFPGQSSGPSAGRSYRIRNIEVDGVRLTFLDSGDANDLGDATEVRVLKPEFSGDNGSGRY